MEFSPKRILGVAIVALALTVGAGVSPALAASDPVVQVKGHVTDPNGDPVAGIKVQSDCGCDFDGGQKPPTHLLGKDTTSKTGFYSYKVRKSVALNISFNDPDRDYIAVGRTAGTTKKNGTGYIIDVEIAKASFISGTIVDNTGAPYPAEIHFYDAKTGKENNSTFSEKDGTYKAQVKAGDYKVKFGGPSYYIGEQWYTGAASKEASPTVSVGYAASVSGINGTVPLKPAISGVLKIDGKNLDVNTGERIAVELVNAAGVRVEKKAVTTGWSFVELTAGTLPAGDYTLKFSPTVKSSAFFAPFSQTVTLPAGGAIKKLIVNTASIPASATDKRVSRVGLEGVTPRQPTGGTTIKGKITSYSYGSTAGGTVKIYIAGKKVATKKLNSAGRANWSYTLPKLSKGNHTIKFVYSGTSTTLPTKHVAFNWYQQ
jgi:hypothetical protein